MKGRLGKFGLIFLALALCLSITGAAFAMWDKTLDISGTVNTGEVDAIFTTATCDDTGIDPGKDKDVGSCMVIGAGTQLLTVTIDNGYPCYECTVLFTIDNVGTVPVKVQSMTIINPPPEVTVTWTDLVIGTQIEPKGEVPGDIHIHVEQSADELATYTFSAKILLVQWNEFT